MGMFSGPKTPYVPLPPPAAHPPTMGSAQIALAGIQSRQRARAEEGAGFADTIKTSPQGVTQPATSAPATLLGG